MRYPNVNRVRDAETCVRSPSRMGWGEPSRDKPDCLAAVVIARKGLLILAACMSLVLSAPCARAAEGAIFGGPVGGTDIRNAYIPDQPGFYGSFVSSNASASELYSGNTATGPLSSKVTIAAFGLMYVPPFKLFGGNVETLVQPNYQYGFFNYKNKRDHFIGLGETYWELGWSKRLGPLFGENGSIPPGSNLPYGMTVKVAYSMIFPTGRYNPPSPTNFYTPGHNVFFYIPNAAVSYLTPPNFLGDGFEISAHFFLDITSPNAVTQYHSYVVPDLDFALSERTGPWQYGIQGYYAQQITHDIRDGDPVNPDGKQLMALALGPVVAYDLPHHGGTIKVKLTVPIGQRNTTSTTRLIVGYSRKF
jgi:hypothetical protein